MQSEQGPRRRCTELNGPQRRRVLSQQSVGVASPGQLWLRRVRGRGAAAGHPEFCGHRESLVPESLSSGRRVLRYPGRYPRGLSAVPRVVYWLPGKTEDPLSGTSGLCFGRGRKDAPAIRGRWHRVPRDGTPREKQCVPDVVPQQGTHKVISPRGRVRQSPPRSRGMASFKNVSAGDRTRSG